MKSETECKENAAVQRRDDRVELGRCGEDFAVRLLRLDGYEILERNFRCREGEIDIIAACRGQLVFAEVKTRRTAAFGRPAEAVDRRKRQHMRRAAARWLQQRPQRESFHSYSFQVIEIMVNRIDHAF